MTVNWNWLKLQETKENIQERAETLKQVLLKLGLIVMLPKSIAYIG